MDSLLILCDTTISLCSFYVHKCNYASNDKPSIAPLRTLNVHCIAGNFRKHKISKIIVAVIINFQKLAS